jgi:P-loop containing region of AAA domain
MIELRHLAMVNWHLFDVADIRIAGHIGVLGENRSGKSTILDMAQVVLTGGNRRFLRLNAVAGDSGRSRSGSKRSVVDYCLGALGEAPRARGDSVKALLQSILRFVGRRADLPAVDRCVIDMEPYRSSIKRLDEDLRELAKIPGSRRRPCPRVGLGLHQPPRQGAAADQVAEGLHRHPAVAGRPLCRRALSNIESGPFRSVAPHLWRTPDRRRAPRARTAAD